MGRWKMMRMEKSWLNVVVLILQHKAVLLNRTNCVEMNHGICVHVVLKKEGVNRMWLSCVENYTNYLQKFPFPKILFYLPKVKKTKLSNRLNSFSHLWGWSSHLRRFFFFRSRGYSESSKWKRKKKLGK